MSEQPALEFGRAFDAYQSFVLATKLYWTRELYPALKRKVAQTNPVEARSADDIEAFAAKDIDYALFSWLERHLQQMKYSGHFGLVPAHESFREQLETWLDSATDDTLLELDANFAAPEYFTRVDIHQHPGGVCGDTLAGVIYERGARSTTPLLDRDLDLHHRLVRAVRERLTPTRIIDLGCGFGKSTHPFYDELANAEITGVDLSAPCLKLAALTAKSAGVRNVKFKQRHAEHTGEASAAFDLVTSTMMLHEMPAAAVEAVIEESYRLLESGGVAIHLDFLAADDPFARFIHYGHARRNNEPYMRPLNELDIVQAHCDAGFNNVEVRPFEEFPGALDKNNTSWRFPWVLIIAEKD